MKSANHTILSLQNLKKYFPIRRGFLQRVVAWVKAVDGVNLQIDEGKTLGLVGESGCGKSTVARLILKLLEPDSGKLVYQGTDYTHFSPEEMKPLRKKMQIVFQDPFGSLNPRMSIGESIGEGLRVQGMKRRREREERVKELLGLVGISPGSADRYPHEFSGGQRQRIGIARALSVDPSLIICDEPVSALDVSIQAQILNLLTELQDRFHLSYLFISHDLNVVGYLSHQVAVMYKGHVMEYAGTDELFENPSHPYTLHLLSAIPGSEVLQKDAAPPDPGLLADLESVQGCKYQARCPLEKPHCREGEIAFREVKENHLVRCWKAATE